MLITQIKQRFSIKILSQCQWLCDSLLTLWLRKCRIIGKCSFSLINWKNQAVMCGNSEVFSVLLISFTHFSFFSPLGDRALFDCGIASDEYVWYIRHFHSVHHSNGYKNSLVLVHVKNDRMGTFFFWVHGYSLHIPGSCYCCNVEPSPESTGSKCHQNGHKECLKSPDPAHEVPQERHDRYKTHKSNRYDRDAAVDCVLFSHFARSWAPPGYTMLIGTIGWWGHPLTLLHILQVGLPVRTPREIVSESNVHTGHVQCPSNTKGSTTQWNKTVPEEEVPKEHSQGPRDL